MLRTILCKKAVARDADPKQLARRLDLDGRERAHRAAVLRQRCAKRDEVVLAEQIARRGTHAVEVERQRDARATQSALRGASASDG